MYTNIKNVTNEQSNQSPMDARGVVGFANNQPGHAWEGWACVPGFSGPVGRNLPIPQTDKFHEGLWISTMQGCCHVIDDQWTITGEWHLPNGTTTIQILVQQNQGAGGDINATIDEFGNISMAKS